MAVENNCMLQHIATLPQNFTNARCVSWDFDLEGMHSVVLIQLLLYSLAYCPAVIVYNL